MFLRTHRWSGQQLGFPSTRLQIQNQQEDDRFKTLDEPHVLGARADIDEACPLRGQSAV